MRTTTSDCVRELDPREADAWVGLLRTNGRLMQALDTALERDHGISLAEYDVLIQLRGAPERSRRMAELADAVLLTRSGVTRLVDRLERRGLVERRQCPSDARGLWAVLTDAGEERLRTAVPDHMAEVRRLFLDRLEGDDVERLGAIWARLAS